MDITRLVRAHIDRFNAAVAIGNFDEMVAHFTEDATMSFEGVLLVRFSGGRRSPGPMWTGLRMTSCTCSSSWTRTSIPST